MGRARTSQAERHEFLIPVSLLIIIIADVSNNKNSIVYLTHIGSALGACLNYLV